MHTRMRLGELLLASGLLSADQLEAALQGQRSSGMKLGEYLIKQGICRESDVVDAVCRQTGIERYTPSRFPLNLSLSETACPPTWRSAPMPSPCSSAGMCWSWR